jgi:hypothetical protein
MTGSTCLEIRCPGRRRQVVEVEDSPIFACDSAKFHLDQAQPQPHPRTPFKRLADEDSTTPILRTKRRRRPLYCSVTSRPHAIFLSRSAHLTPPRNSTVRIPIYISTCPCDFRITRFCAHQASQFQFNDVGFVVSPVLFVWLGLGVIVGRIWAQKSGQENSAPNFAYISECACPFLLQVPIGFKPNDFQVYNTTLPQ